MPSLQFVVTFGNLGLSMASLYQLCAVDKAVAASYRIAPIGCLSLELDHASKVLSGRTLLVPVAAASAVSSVISRQLAGQTVLNVATFIAAN